jgi:hypothetical protein
MDRPKQKPEMHRWWVVFQDPDFKAWWHRPARWLGWTAPGCGHCWAFREAAPGAIMVVDPTLLQVGITLHVGWPYRWNSDILRLGKTVWVVETPGRVYYPGAKIPLRLVPLTCASIIAIIIGLPRLPSTPVALRRYLSIHGKELRHELAVRETAETLG